MAHQRGTKNLIGNELRANRGDADQYNNLMIKDKLSVHSSGLNENDFPKTTNQDFHGQEVFHKAVSFGNRMDKANFKR
jgi:hypothetical protein